MFLRRKEHVDPLTGDTLTRQERLSLLAQAAMRQWKFVIAYTALTAVWWIHPTWFGDHPGNDARWQDMASYMALLIESVVGIGMFGWARRDSVVLRKLYALERAAEQRDEMDQALMHVIAKHTEALLADVEARSAKAHANLEAAQKEASAADAALQSLQGPGDGK